MAARKRYWIGDIIAIPLDNERFAYGKLFCDSAIGVFSRTTQELADFEPGSFGKYVLFCGYFRLKSDEWPIIGKEPFETQEDSWPPPMFINTIIWPELFYIYEKGETRHVSAEETKGLFPQIQHSPESLVKRIHAEFKIDSKGHLKPIRDLPYRSRVELQ